jgi:adenylate cyclase
MLTIPDPASAVLLGLQIAHELMLGHGAPAVRVGLHHGQAVERDGDYFGAAVNLAARVSAEASGGEVLLTGETAAMAPDLEGVLYESRGRRALRNVREPVELFAAVRAGAATHGLLPQDPVCRMAVDPDRAPGRLVYEGSAYFFCSLACAAEFARRPERFAVSRASGA